MTLISCKRASSQEYKPHMASRQFGSLVVGGSWPWWLWLFPWHVTPIINEPFHLSSTHQKVN